MHLNHNIPPLPTLRCSSCNRKFGEAMVFGLIHHICPRCKEDNLFIDGENVPLRRLIGPLSDEVVPTNTLAKPPDMEEILAIMEERWESVKAMHAQRRVDIAVGVRFEVFSRDGFRCQYCGRSASGGALLEVDHILPRSKGGRDDPSNLLTACVDCNRGKSDKLIEGVTA